jgi:hypothetical protein
MAQKFTCRHYPESVVLARVINNKPFRDFYRPLSAWLVAPFTSAGVPIAYSIAPALNVP